MLEKDGRNSFYHLVQLVEIGKEQVQEDGEVSVSFFFYSTLVVSHSGCTCR